MSNGDSIKDYFTEAYLIIPKKEDFASVEVHTNFLGSLTETNGNKTHVITVDAEDTASVGQSLLAEKNLLVKELEKATEQSEPTGTLPQQIAFFEKIADMFNQSAFHKPPENELLAKVQEKSGIPLKADKVVLLKGISGSRF